MSNRLAIDFDGVLMKKVPARKKPAGLIGDPMPGALEALRALAPLWELVVFTCRADSIVGRIGVEDWLKRHDVLELISYITNEKPIATAYIDDRGVCFTHWGKILEEFENEGGGLIWTSSGEFLGKQVLPSLESEIRRVTGGRLSDGGQN